MFHPTEQNHIYQALDSECTNIPSIRQTGYGKLIDGLTQTQHTTTNDRQAIPWQ